MQPETFWAFKEPVIGVWKSALVQLSCKKSPSERSFPNQKAKHEKLLLEADLLEFSMNTDFLKIQLKPTY